MLHHAKVESPHPAWNAYREEEIKFMKTVREVAINDVPQNANIITNHVIYKVKANVDGTLKMKAQIATHGNEDSDRHLLKTDYCECTTLEFEFLLQLLP